MPGPQVVKHTLQRLLQHLVDLSNLLQLRAIVRQRGWVGCAELYIYCWLPYVLHQEQSKLVYRYQAHTA